MTSPSADIAEFVRRRRVHFEIEREHIDGSLERPPEFLLRLFALHEAAAHLVPGCPCCRRLAAELRRLAATTLSGGNPEADVEIGLVPPVLYECRAFPGRAEVALNVHVWPYSRGSPARAADDERAWITRRLKRLGVAAR